ncbi:ABC transporter ATP-binding protein [Bradyrhizobium sp. BR13661]|jgi:peptide/nickel transport system ATP-binding protein|uniref:ABC transporter ATP-binding protein n=1 Tax=Bradyrhizobium sp. BR13661 TaxID=2940622 RepID=UPI002475CF29|nr:ABC transporter ATP-binding protein [Bradyrhizobium sp. BR13661]MDH6261792.1 peptide/nickel transport system ATP-binding protein [Bradyrhizobium sp. BR13661]
MKSASSHLLDVKGLTVVSDEKVVLSDVSFTIGRDEVLGIVGETGAGKSVLARALIKLLPDGLRAMAGEIHINGASISDFSKEDDRRLRGGNIALIGTNAKALLDPVQTVGMQVAKVLQAHRGGSSDDAWRAAIDLFTKVGIVDPERRAKAYPHELSGGMAQRVIIAMALIAQPQVVLADDATLGLDATIQVQVLDLLIARCRELGLGVVLITHDLGIVAHYCDRVAIMRGGKIVELRPVGEFLERPETDYGRDLIAAAKIRPTPMIEAERQGAQSESPSGALLQVTNLKKYFPLSDGQVVKAVDDVTFSIGKGQTLALVGESGSGKTTMGQCLVRLLDVDSGAVLFDGQSVTNLEERRFRPLRRRIQMVFQEPYVALNPRWRVEELIAEPLRLDLTMDSGARSRRVKELLDMVHLPARAAQLFPHEITAGEQKRVGIARALATNPDFVIFDEPTTALDIRVRAQIIDLVRELQQRMGLSALFITHDLNSVRSLAHDVAVMRYGKIVEHGPTEQVFNSPAHDYTRMLLSAELPIEQSEKQRSREESKREGLRRVK